MLWERAPRSPRVQLMGQLPTIRTASAPWAPSSSPGTAALAVIGHQPLSTTRCDATAGDPAWDQPQRHTSCPPRDLCDQRYQWSLLGSGRAAVGGPPTPTGRAKWPARLARQQLRQPKGLVTGVTEPCGSQ